MQGMTRLSVQAFQVDQEPVALTLNHANDCAFAMVQ